MALCPSIFSLLSWPRLNVPASSTFALSLPLLCHRRFGWRLPPRSLASLLTRALLLSPVLPSAARWSRLQAKMPRRSVTRQTTPLSVCLSRNQRAPMHYCAVAVTYEGEGHIFEEVIMPESGNNSWSPLKGRDRNHGVEHNEQVHV